MECDGGSSAGRRKSSRIQAIQVNKRENESTPHLDQAAGRKKLKVCRKQKEKSAHLGTGVDENGGDEVKNEVLQAKQDADGGIVKAGAEAMDSEPVKAGAEAMDAKSVKAGAEVMEAKPEKAGAEAMDAKPEKAGAEVMDAEPVKASERGITEKSASARVIEAIRAFNKHYLHFVQEEEKRCRKKEVDDKKLKSPKTQEGETSSGKVKKSLKKGKNQKKEKADVPKEESKTVAKRPDLKALKKMKETKEILIPETRIGNIPGIDVGYKFFSRAEMVAVGFHCHWLNGIDFIGTGGSKGIYSKHKLPLAVAIVISGQYEDDVDNAEQVVYTGQGGNNLLGNKRQIRDQELLRGNLGLKNCMEDGTPVRVVRGHKCKEGYVGKVYTYDGLYKVEKFWAEKGISGFTVYKFQLKRIEGQCSLTTEQVNFTRAGVPKSISELRGLVCEDISQGQENIPIPATNLVDDPPVAPTGFTYCNSLQISRSVKIPANASGCNCKGEGGCKDPRTCSCAKLNGSDFPYVLRDGGRLVEARDVVFECGPNCGCGPECVNRVSQRGIRHRLEVFKTPSKGWGVRSWDTIRSGSVICEYIGYLRKTDDLDTVKDDSYIFDIDCLQTIKGLDGRERRFRDVSISHLVKDDDKENGPEFCIDAGTSGNVARFINHSCQPNLFVQCVLSDHHDMRLARVILFAADNIPALKELTYDYGYVLNSVVGADGKIKKMPCYCGAPDCRKRLY